MASTVTKRVGTMEAKKNGARAGSRNVDAKKMFSFFGDVKAEFKKISWTTKEELKIYTKIVVGATIAFGFVIFAMDLVIKGGLMGFGRIIKLIAG